MPKIDKADLEWLLSQAPDKVPQATDWYRIEAKAKSRKATVYIMEEISSWGAGARQFSESVAQLDVDEIELHINSPGGSFPEGIAIMNMLRDHKATVNAQVDGLAASAATLVALGADHVTMKRGSQMMIHEGSGLVYGPMADMLRMAQLLEKTNAQMAELYAERAGGTVAEWRKAMAEETWYNAQEAVDAGLADTLDASGKEDEAVAARNRFDLTVFAHAGRDKAPAPFKPTAAPSERNPKEGEEMPNQALVTVATSLGIKDADKFADDSSLSEAITKAHAEAVKTAEAKAKDAPGSDPKPDEGEKPESKPSVKIPDGFVLLDKSTVDALQTSASAADKALEKIEERERDSALDAAVHDGKIPNARREHWVSFWKSDPEGAKAALEALPKNLVPVTPVGIGGSGEGAEVDADYVALYPDEVN